LTIINGNENDWFYLVTFLGCGMIKQGVRRLPRYAPTACFDLLTLKVVSVPILVFLGLSVLDLGPMYVTDRHQTNCQDAHHRLIMPPVHPMTAGA